MNQKICFLPLSVAILFAGSPLQPAVAYGNRSDSGAGLPGQPPAAAMPAFELHAPDVPLPKPASLRQRLAHAILVRSSPEKGTAVPETVGKVEVWYDSAVRDDFVTLAVINAAGDRIDKHDASIDSADQTHVFTSVDALTPGEYTVRYRAVSTDGYLASGAWTFEVRP